VGLRWGTSVQFRRHSVVDRVSDADGVHARRVRRHRRWTPVCAHHRQHRRHVRSRRHTNSAGTARRPRHRVSCHRVTGHRGRAVPETRRPGGAFRGLPPDQRGTAATGGRRRRAAHRHIPVSGVGRRRSGAAERHPGQRDVADPAPAAGVVAPVGRPGVHRVGTRRRYRHRACRRTRALPVTGQPRRPGWTV